MNIIEAKPAGLYPENAGTLKIAVDGMNHWTAYMVLGRAGDDVLVVEGSGSEEIAAIEHLLRKVKVLRDYTDLTCHGEFWPMLEKDKQNQREEMRRALSGLLGGTGTVHVLGGTKKHDDDDDGGMS
jgi:hypothetical protein